MNTKRRTTINSNSRAHEEAVLRGDYIDIIRIPNARQHGIESSADLIGLEWHHAAGRAIAIFCKNDAEIERAKAIQEKAKADIKDALFTSKKAAWRWLEEHGLDTDAGFGGIEYKDGQYGRFRCSFGQPDGVVFYPCARSRDTAERLL